MGWPIYVRCRESLRLILAQPGYMGLSIICQLNSTHKSAHAGAMKAMASQKWHASTAFGFVAVARLWQHNRCPG